MYINQPIEFHLFPIYLCGPGKRWRYHVHQEQQIQVATRSVANISRPGSARLQDEFLESPVSSYSAWVWGSPGGGDFLLVNVVSTIRIYIYTYICIYIYICWG